ncbi:MAG: polymorphic toxin-type HINT domain-containing protein [Candidatus Dormibacteria bacterium]
MGVRVATDEGGSALEDALASCGGQSFSAGSQVVLASGSAVAISQLWVGAQVLATNPQTGKTQPETVDAVMVNHDTDLMDVVVNTAQGEGTIDSTAHHLFWDLTTRKWTETDQLRAGDRLFTPDGQLVTVARLVTVPGAEDMWDLTIANDHDFYVVTVDTAVLVHNCPLSAGYEDPELLQQAQEAFPNKAGSIEYHHIVPQYLGGLPEGPTVGIDASYHQLLTNAFRAAWGYGQGVPSSEQLAEILSNVYGQVPLNLP